MDGILILDKPRGPTCQKILSRFRKVFPKKKIGYTGTLDPFATGVLPIFIGEATKLIPFIDEGRKVYEATLKLGERTDTLDCEGKVVETAPVPPLNEGTLRQVLAGFLGERLQTPPKFSAVKVGGTPLYRLARKGVEVEVTPRGVEIFSLELLDFQAPLVRFRAEASQGTYIRVLASEIAQALNTCGHLTELKRLSSGKFCLKTSISIELMNDYFINKDKLAFLLDQNLKQVLQGFRRRELKDPVLIERHLQGQTICVGEKEEGAFNEGWVMAYHKDSIFSVSEEIQSPHDQKYYLKPLRVFNPPWQTVQAL